MNCDLCRIGHYRTASAPYLRWIGDQIMVVPDVPALICDVCGDTAYDDQFISRVQFLLERLKLDGSIGDVTTRQMKIEDSPSGNRSEGVEPLVS